MIDPHSPEPQNPEKCALDLGFVPLLDAAPLIVAQEAGFFEEAGLTVALHREANWASIRDKLVFGLLDGAHLLAPMVVASQVPTTPPRPMAGLTTALSLGYNGNAITFSNSLARSLDIPLPGDPGTIGRTLKDLIATRSRRGEPRLVFGTVYPFSMHTYLLRLFLGNSGIDPDRDVDIRVIPPPKMVDALSQGEVDGYCVGEPWNTEAALTGRGQVALLGYDIWQNAPEKVLGVNERFARDLPGSHQALVGAVLRACHWLDQPDRVASVAHWLAAPDYLDCSSDLLLKAMQTEWHDGCPRWHKQFFRHAATFPWRSQAEWMLQQMVPARQIAAPPADPTAVVARAYDTDTWRIVARRLGVQAPREDYKPENTHETAYRELGVELGPNRRLSGA